MKTKELLSDIRFWIFLFFVIRLIGITNPPLEVSHNWRQTTVTMVARNFLEVDNNIFYPRVDIAGEKTGITGMEFPLLNYMIYLSAELFGYQHWYGRLINLIISSFGLWFFFKLSSKYFKGNTAFYSTIILAVSIWFQFSRKIMPDTFAMSFIIASIYYGTNYLEQSRKNIVYLLGYFLLMVLGVLSKLPSGYLLVVLGLLYFDKNISINKKIIFAVVSLIGIIPVIIWYFYWVPYLVETYGFWHFFMGKSFEQGFNEIIQNFPQTLSRFYETALKFIGFAIFLFGLIYAIIKKETLLLVIFAISFLSFSVIIFKAGFTFPHHSYYIIPFVPIMALIAGYGLTKIKYPKLAIFLLVAISVEGISNQQHDFRIKEKDEQMLKLEKDLNTVSKPNDLILINSGKYPTPMYFSHRKGWVDGNDKIKDGAYIEELRTKGLKYIVILKRTFGSDIALSHYEKVIENEDYAIYKANTIANK